MTPLQCFIAKISKGIVSEKAGARLAETVDAFEKEYLKRGKKAEEALRRAAQDAADDELKIAAREAELALGNIRAQLDVLKTTQAYAGVLGDLRAEGKAPLWLKDPRKSPLASAMRSLLTRDPAEIGGWANVHYQATNLRGQAHAMFRDGIGEMRPTQFGLKRQTTLELEVLQAIKNKGAQVSDTARGIAESWGKVAEKMRTDFVDALGALPFRADWGLPNPVHDTLKVRSIAKADWMDFIRPLLDRKAMLDFDTGRILTDRKLDQLLGEMYDTVAAGGAEGAPSAAARGQGALSSRRADHRFIVFKTAENWLEYDQKFGSGSGVYQTMMSHIDSMTHDTAMLQVLGPNPDATKRFILSMFDREGARLAKAASLAKPGDVLAAFKDNAKIQSYVNTGRKSFEALFSEITGANKIPVNIEMGHMMGEVRAALTASKMGSAIISSFADLSLASMTARLNGLPVGDLLARAAKGMVEKDFELNAAQLGLVADSIAMTHHQNDRFMGEAIRTGRMQQLASGVVAASGLRRWSGVLRVSFGMEFMAQGANRMHLGWSDLPKDFRASMERYQLTSSDWDVIRRASPTEPRTGAKFLSAIDIREVEGGKGRVADSWQRMIDTEMDHAVIEGDPITRALILGESRPGTAEGEIRRSMGQFKAFPITFINLHFARAFARGFDGERMSHAALTFAAMWAMGMVSMQTKEVLKGRDPLSMDPTTRAGLRAWGAGALMSGGLGIFGDLLFQDQTRQTTSFAGALAGPLAGDIDKVLGDWLIGNVQKAAKGEKTHFAGDALYALGGLVPGQSLWYARTAFQRGVLDQLARMIDDRAPERFRRVEKEAEKSWGQQFWWEPGAVTPRRAPDMNGPAR